MNLNSNLNLVLHTGSNMQNSPKQSAIAKVFAKAKCEFFVFTSAIILLR